jgi:seryl-tRNA synthetase
MLDIQFIRDHAPQVRQAAKDKQLDEMVVDAVLSADLIRRETQQRVDALRASANANAKAIQTQVQSGRKPDPQLIADGKAIKDQLKIEEPKLKTAEEEFGKAMYNIPNLPAEDVPVGKNETGNLVKKEVGQPPKFDFEVKPHQVIMENLGWLDTKRAVGMAGFRAYFLKGQGLLLEQALLRMALDMMVQAGFTPMSAPILLNEPAMWGTGYFPWGQEDHYRTQDGQFLAGTSEVALTAFHTNETLREEDLPIKMTGISPCFRREIGAHGKDTQGIIRVHQFNKIEQVVYTVADETETRKWHDTMAGLSEQLLTDLELSYRVLTMCTGDMGAGQRKKYDIETWFPAQNTYRETHSASYFNDFQARRLNIRYQAKDGTLKYVYTLNNTMAATPRLLAALVENHQQADGTIKIPVKLQEYL